MGQPSRASRLVLRIKYNPGALALFTQVGVTVAGALILLVFMMTAVPMIRYFLWPFFWRGVLALLVAGALSVLFNWRHNLALFSIARNALPEKDITGGRKEVLADAASYLPVRLLFLTLLLWPATTLSIGFWMNLAGFLPISDALRMGATGVLYCPLQGFIFYYLIRLSMRRLVEFLYSYGQEEARVVVGRWSLRSRLVWSFACLSLVPLLAGVLLYGVHKEHDTADQNLDKTCLALEAVHAAGSGKSASWNKAIKQVLAGFDLPASSRFMVIDHSGKLLAGGMDWNSRRVWSREMKEGPARGSCRPKPVPGTRQYVVMRYFPSPGIWVNASLYPLSEADSFSFFSGITLILALFVVGLGSLIGYLASTDVVKSLQSISGEAQRMARGRYEPVSGLLADMEVQELVDSLNSLSISICRELQRSEKGVSEIQDIIGDLAECSAQLQSHADRQREILDEQGPMVSQAEEKAREVTAAAGSIRNEAQGTRDHMREVFERAGSAGKTLQNLQEIVKEVDHASSRLVEEMEKLESNYRRLEEVVTIIDDVADRTELVALNASLESSSTEGGSSRFSVVASEIQRLSDSISRQTSAIKTVFNQVRNSSMEMVQYIEINRNKSANTPEWMAKLFDALENIRTKAHHGSSAMEKIESRAGEQNGALEQMQMIVGEIKSMSEIMDEASKGTEHTSWRLTELSKRLREGLGDSDRGSD